MSPEKNSTAGPVAHAIDQGLVRLYGREKAADATKDAKIAYLQGLVAAHLTFEELMGIVVPMSFWWNGYSGWRELIA